MRLIQILNHNLGQDRTHGPSDQEKLMLSLKEPGRLTVSIVKMTNKKQTINPKEKLTNLLSVKRKEDREEMHGETYPMLIS